MTLQLNNYELYATHYNSLHADKVETLARSLVRRFPGYNVPEDATALDLGCGTGILLGELARYGLRGTGVDLSSHMTNMARRNHPTIDFVTSDMCALALNQRFDVVLSTSDAINYLAPERRTSFFGTIARHMKPKGLCYIDFDTETDFTNFWDGQKCESVGKGWRLIRSYYYDDALRIGTELQEWDIESEGKRQTFNESHTLFPVSTDEVCSLAQNIGLSVDQFVEPVELQDTNESLDEYLRLGCFIRSAQNSSGQTNS